MEKQIILRIHTKYLKEDLFSVQNVFCKWELNLIPFPQMSKAPSKRLWKNISTKYSKISDIYKHYTINILLEFSLLSLIYIQNIR